jgi:hypothetical protein
MRSLRLAGAAMLLCAMAGSIPRATGGEPDEYLVKEGNAYRLDAPLVFRVERWGINLNGEEMNIEPSGRWRYARFYRGEDRKDQYTDARNGQLTQEQLISLAKTMAAQDLNRWPARIGPEPKVNPQKYVMKHGERATVLAGISSRPGQKIGEKILAAARAPGLPDPDAWKRFGALADAIESLTKPAPE